VRVVIFGATGMVGKGVLLECLDDPRVDRVLLVSRQPVDVTHPKIEEVLHQDFFDFAGLQPRFTTLDACFFCLGVSSVGLTESDYHHLTYDLTLAAATALAAATGGRLGFRLFFREGAQNTRRGPGGTLQRSMYRPSTSRSRLASSSTAIPVESMKVRRVQSTSRCFVLSATNACRSLRNAGAVARSTSSWSE